MSAYEEHMARVAHNKALLDFFETMHFAYTTLYGYSRIAQYRCYIPAPPNGKDAKDLLREIEKICEKEELVITSH